MQRVRLKRHVSGPSLITQPVEVRTDRDRHALFERFHGQFVAVAVAVASVHCFHGINAQCVEFSSKGSVGTP